MRKPLKKASRAKRAAPSKIKRTSKKATATAARVRDKAHKLMSRIQSAEHGAADLTTRIGSTMETIGSALVSLVAPTDRSAKPKRSKRAVP